MYFVNVKYQKLWVVQIFPLMFDECKVIVISTDIVYIIQYAELNTKIHIVADVVSASLTKTKLKLR
jgi:hypothetical protein